MLFSMSLLGLKGCTKFIWLILVKLSQNLFHNIFYFEAFQKLTPFRLTHLSFPKRFSVYIWCFIEVIFSKSGLEMYTTTL